MDIKNILSTLKTEIDNNSYLIIFRDGTNISFSKEWSELRPTANSPNNWSIVIQPMINEKRIKVIYFKISNYWINFTKLKNMAPTFSLLNIGNANRDLYEVDKKFIPETEFIDIDSKVWSISSCDNSYNDNKLHLIDYNNSIHYNVTLELVDLNKPANNDKKHLTDDIKITITSDDLINHPIELDNILVNLNGNFVPITVDGNVIYIKHGKFLLNTKQIGIKSIPITVKQDVNGHNTPTVNEDNLEMNNYKYGYSIELKIFKWTNLIINEWEQAKVVFDTLPNTTTNNYDVTFIKELKFYNKINKDSHMLIYNGSILKEGVDYYVHDTRLNVTLINMKQKMSVLFSEFRKKYPNKPAYYFNQYTNRLRYYIINFDSKNPLRKSKIKYSQSVIKNIPYINQVIFENNTIDCIPIIDGIYARHIRSGNNIVEFPRLQSGVNNIIYDENKKYVNFNNSRIESLFFTEI